MSKVRSFWGWGYKQDELKKAEIKKLSNMLSGFVGIDGKLQDAPKVEDLKLPHPKIKLPKSLESLADNSLAQRAQHSYGRSFKDVVRGLNNSFDGAPDAVVFPKTENDVINILEFSEKKNIAVVCYGGGSSVVGGVEMDSDYKQNYSGWISLDMSYMNALSEIDTYSRSAKFQTGILGPQLETKLKKYGLTLRHFPQSFEFSSLGGWIATRAGGHFAMGPTHIDDLLESVEVITPSGKTVSRRLPASGAGPDENRLWLGSEGILGIITSAYVKVQPRPIYVAKADILFESFKEGINCLKEIAQSGLNPSNCRLLDPLEALINGVSSKNKAVLLLGFESYNNPVNFLYEEAKKICLRNKGTLASELITIRGNSESDSSNKSSAAELWKASFIKAPYIRDALVRLGLIVETFETAVTWNNFDELYENVISGVQRNISKSLKNLGWITCRITHAYQNGLAPYFSVIAKGDQGSQISKWNEIKLIANETVVKYNGTVTHHHAVGKDHREAFAKEKSSLYLDYLKAAKTYFDPQTILNPGTLIKI
jgi:alkyldihydroxyacetonephosphate synthase